MENIGQMIWWICLVTTIGKLMNIRWKIWFYRQVLKKTEKLFKITKDFELKALGYFTELSYILSARQTECFLVLLLFIFLFLFILSTHRALLCFLCWSSEAFSFITCPDFFNELLVDLAQLSSARHLNMIASAW